MASSRLAVNGLVASTMIFPATGPRAGTVVATASHGTARTITSAAWRGAGDRHYLEALLPQVGRFHRRDCGAANDTP